jgi:hypothetical protein
MGFSLHMFSQRSRAGNAAKGVNRQNARLLRLYRRGKAKMEHKLPHSYAPILSVVVTRRPQYRHSRLLRMAPPGILRV